MPCLDESAAQMSQLRRESSGSRNRLSTSVLNASSPSTIWIAQP